MDGLASAHYSLRFKASIFFRTSSTCAWWLYLQYSRLATEETRNEPMSQLQELITSSRSKDWSQFYSLELKNRVNPMTSPKEIPCRNAVRAHGTLLRENFFPFSINVSQSYLCPWASEGKLVHLIFFVTHDQILMRSIYSSLSPQLVTNDKIK